MTNLKHLYSNVYSLLVPAYVGADGKPATMAHQYEVESEDPATGRQIYISVAGRSRTQAASAVKRAGFPVHSVNMVG